MRYWYAAAALTLVGSALFAQVTRAGTRSADPTMSLAELLAKGSQPSDTIWAVRLPSSEGFPTDANPCASRGPLPDSVAVVSDGSRDIPGEVRARYRNGQVSRPASSFNVIIRPDTLWLRISDLRCGTDGRDASSARPGQRVRESERATFLLTRGKDSIVIRSTALMLLSDLQAMEAGAFQAGWSNQFAASFGAFGRVKGPLEIFAKSPSALETGFPIQMHNQRGDVVPAVWDGRSMRPLTNVVDSLVQLRLRWQDSVKTVRTAEDAADRQRQEQGVREAAEGERRDAEARKAQRLQLLQGTGATAAQRDNVLQGKVTLGMTPQMVRAAWLVAPDRTGVAQEGGVQITIWFFGSGAVVKFTNGRVSAVVN